MMILFLQYLTFGGTCMLCLKMNPMALYKALYKNWSPDINKMCYKLSRHRE